MKKLTIAMIGQKNISVNDGEIERHVIGLSTKMIELGNRVIVYVMNRRLSKKIKKFNGIEIYSLPVILHTFLAFIHSCLFMRADILHIHGIENAIFVWMSKILRPQSIIVVTIHGLNKNKNAIRRFLSSFGERMAIKYADEVIVTSKRLQNYIKIEHDVVARYLPSGISPQRVAVSDLVLKSFHLSSFGYIAMTSKSLDVNNAKNLIKAWKQIASNYPDLVLNTKLAIIESEESNSVGIQDLKNMCLGDSSIVFTGCQKGEVLDSLFAGARFIVNPSSVFDAMSYGKAIILNDTSKHAQIIKQYGALFLDGDVDDLVVKIVDFLKDSLLTASLGHSARYFVESEYNWDDIAGEILSIYEKYHALRNGVFVVE